MLFVFQLYCGSAHLAINKNTAVHNIHIYNTEHNTIHIQWSCTYNHEWWKYGPDEQSKFCYYILHTVGA